jgi:hypothetical protein
VPGYEIEEPLHAIQMTRISVTFALTGPPGWIKLGTAGTHPEARQCPSRSITLHA